MVEVTHMFLQCRCDRKSSAVLEVHGASHCACLLKPGSRVRDACRIAVEIYGCHCYSSFRSC